MKIIKFEYILPLMRDLIDKIINVLKWPTAVFAVIMLPALLCSVRYFNFTNTRFLFFLGGGFLYFISSMSMDKSVRASIQVLGHELTHSLFAFLTFHKVKRVEIKSDDTGGSMKFEGIGNWLIIAAPYFFPFFCAVYAVVAAVVMMFLKIGLLYHLLFGYFAGYYVDIVFSQLHNEQTDLKKLGALFCFMFLPAANLWMCGNLLAYNVRGWEGLILYQKLLGQLAVSNWHAFWHFL
ncbi:MAG: M50 family metallopeptidase [Alphaproteobacteria bacterium]|nr:M50 family metallopeptidase [Alphaproteobacteria bacterium]